MTHNKAVVAAFFASEGLPMPLPEFKFHPTRKWRFDLAFIGSSKDNMLAIEIQGGLFCRGRHTQGAALLKEYEKLNEACALGWRVLFVQPKDLLTVSTANLIKRALGMTPKP